MGSLNISLWAEPEARKVWFAFGCDDAENVLNRYRSLSMEAEKVLKGIKASWARQAMDSAFCCSNFWRNKNLNVSLEMLNEWATKTLIDQPPVKIYIGHQQPKDLIVTLPRSWHQVLNTGSNSFLLHLVIKLISGLMVNEAVQHCPFIGWTFHGMNASVCECHGAAVRVDAKEIHSIIEPMIAENDPRIPTLPAAQLEWLENILQTVQGMHDETQVSNLPLDLSQQMSSLSMEMGAEDIEHYSGLVGELNPFQMQVDEAIADIVQPMEVEARVDIAVPGNSGIKRGRPPGKTHCEICDRDFCRAQKLTQHLEKDHDVPCPNCDLMFISDRHLTEHHMIRHPELVVVCPVPGCGKGFKNQESLKKHQRTYHK